MDLVDREWRIVSEEAHPGPTNMALDAVAAETTAEGGPRTLRVYRWEPSTLSLGYGQRSSTVDWDFCERERITVTRRPTGGGGIYHDAFGDISYSIVVPADEVPGDLMECYSLLLSPVFDAFDRMGVPARMAEEPQPAIHPPACYLRELHPAHDVVVDGRKISGNAQYRREDVVIQHGSITFARETERHLAAFENPGAAPDEFEERVASVRAEAGIGRETAVDALETALSDWVDAEPGSWTEDELSLADEVASERFTNDDWTRRR